MDDKPNKKGDMPPEKFADTPATTALSVADTSTSVYSESTAAVPRNARRDEGVLMQRSILNHQVYVFALLSAGSFGAFLIFALPFSALAALLCFAASTLALFYMAYRIVLLELQNILQGRGIGDYLPSSIYQQLTTTSVHEWMMDSAFFMENRYLLLYFIPGVSQEQLDSYLERLPARHQYVLTRPGLGQFLGSDFMRVIMGTSRYNNLLLEDAREEEIIQHDAGGARRLFEAEQEEVNGGAAAGGADDDLDSVFSLDLSEGDLGMMVDEPPQQQQQQAPMARSINVPSSNSQQQQEQQVVVAAPHPLSLGPENIPEEELEQEYNEESDILTEAVAAMTTSYSTMITNAATGYAVQAVDSISPYIIGLSATVTLGTMSIGVWGWWTGVYHPSRTSLPPPHFPSSRTLVSTALFGGVSAGAMLLVRTAARSVIQSDRASTKHDSTKKQKDQSEEDKKK